MISYILLQGVKAHRGKKRSAYHHACAANKRTKPIPHCPSLLGNLKVFHQSVSTKKGIFFNQPPWAQAPTQLSGTIKGGRLSLYLQWHTLPEHSQRDLHAKNYQCLHTVYITGPQCLSSNHFTFPPAKQQISHFTRLSHSFRRDGAILSVGDMANQGYPKPPL